MRGGKRKNSGQKLKYGELTKTLAFRVPISKEKEVKQIISNYLKSFVIQK